MINVVIDTNVIVSALLKPNGPNRQAIRKAIDPKTPLRICFSSQIVDEYQDVLHRGLLVSRGLSSQADELLDLILQVGDEVVPKYVPAIVYPDEKDRQFLEAAIYVDGILLTNNLKDYPFLGVVIVAPEEFIGWCEERGIE